jgi:hypothetical protein
VSETFDRVIELIGNDEVRTSEHGYDELAEDALFARDIVEGARSGIVVEDYPEYYKRPSVLVLQKDGDGRPVHVVWGIPKGKNSPAVVVTAYRPDPARWTEDFLSRKGS